MPELGAEGAQAEQVTQAEPGAQPEPDTRVAETLEQKQERLTQFFRKNQRAALGFSGGVDSSFLLCFSHGCGADVRPYFVKTAFQPQFELDDARRLTRELGLALTVLDLDILKDEAVRRNSADRCYFCKQRIFSLILAKARQEGFTLLIDGTNADDDAADRPGMQAISELAVRSPLREAGLTKLEIRELSRDAGLFTWDKPAYACLATRLQAGVEITADALQKTENAENLLFAMGFRDFRLRQFDGMTILELRAEDFSRAVLKRDQITAALRPYYSRILLDLRPRPGSVGKIRDSEK